MNDEDRVILGKSRPVYNFKDLFKVNEVLVEYQAKDGKPSQSHTFVVFERGDSAAILLINTDTEEIILTRQFRIGAGQTKAKGFILELPAGIIKPHETPKQAIIRETKEETGFQIVEPEFISCFFPSPGASSERIFIFYAEVTNAQKISEGGGVAADGERVLPVSVKSQDFLASIEAGEIQDGKTQIAALWLKDDKRKKDQEREKNRRRRLEPSTVKFRLRSDSNVIIGYKTGDIIYVKDVDIWVNSENTYMEMDRTSGKTISANIRWHGAIKKGDRIEEDTIYERLKSAKGGVFEHLIGKVIDTTPGALSHENNVKRIVHVATVRTEGPGRGFIANVDNIGECATKAITHADKWARPTMFRGPRAKSVLLPIFGTGDGRLSPHEVVPELLKAAIGFFKDNPESAIKEVYLLAYSQREQDHCEAIFCEHVGLESA